MSALKCCSPNRIFWTENMYRINLSYTLLYSISEVMLMILFGCRKLVRSSLASSCARLLLQSWVPWVPKNIEFHTRDNLFFSLVVLKDKDNFLYQIWVKPTFCPKITQPLLIWIFGSKWASLRFAKNTKEFQGKSILCLSSFLPRSFLVSMTMNHFDLRDHLMIA